MSRINVCNQCGKTIDEENKGLSVYHYLGYGSKYDGERIALDLCDECFDKFIESLKISPIIEPTKNLAYEV